MNSEDRAYNRGVIDGVRLLYSEIVRRQKNVGLEAIVNQLTDILETSEAIVNNNIKAVSKPKSSLPPSEEKLPNTEWYFTRFADIPSNKDNQYNVIYKREIPANEYELKVHDACVEMLLEIEKDIKEVIEIEKNIYKLELPPVDTIGTSQILLVVFMNICEGGRIEKRIKGEL